MAASVFSEIQNTININQVILDRSLTHLFLMHTFFTPWKHQKTVDGFREYRKGSLQTSELKIKNISQIKYKTRQTQQEHYPERFFYKRTRTKYKANVLYCTVLWRGTSKTNLLRRRRNKNIEKPLSKTSNSEKKTTCQSHKKSKQKLKIRNFKLNYFGRKQTKVILNS